MKKAILCTVVLAMLQSVPNIASAEQSPISVSFGYKINQFNSSRYPTATVIAEDDQVTIYSVTANRGNCKIFAADLGSMQRTLEYGQQVTYRSNNSNCPQYRELVVETDKGTWVSKPNR